MGTQLACVTFVMSSLFLALLTEEINKDPRITPLSTGNQPSTSSSTEVTEIASTTSTQSYEVTTKSNTGGRTNVTLTEKVATTSPVETTGNSRITTVDTAQTDAAVDDSSPTSLTTHSTTSSASTSSSSDYRTVIIANAEHIGKRSTDTEDLPDDACESEDGHQILQRGKLYDIYKVDLSSDGWDEKTMLEVTCQLTDEVRDRNCKGWVKSTVQNVSLEVNGTQDAEFTREYYSEENVMTFTAMLHYESHDKAKISCVHSLKSGAKLVSLNNTLNRVDELHYYTITPEELHVTIGESFALTCKTDSTRGLDSLRWKVKKNDEGIDVTIHRDEKIVAGLNYNMHEFRDNLHSVLNVTTKNDGKFKSRIDYTFSCTETFEFHLKQHLGKAQVTIHPVDYSLRNAAIGVGVSIPVLIFIATVLFVRRRRKLRSALAVSIRMTETRNAIMQIARQTSNENEGERRATDAFMMAIETVNSIMDRISKKHSPWEKDKSKIQIKAQIGEGNFGVVLSGTMPNEFGIIETVAIKTIKEQGIEVSALLDFEKEMEVMVTLKHRNIVNLLGICTVSLPFYIIMEYMENGQLNNYLTKFAPSRDTPLGGLSVGQLAWMCQQPCDALEYLAANNMVHRDVSARNCLVSYNLQVKLADFGLSRDTSVNDKNYYKKEGGMVPIKWMAPEALTYGRYTTANDVWAFGILAWEVFSFGALPYQHLTNQQVMVNICKGERLDRPHLCPEGLWEVLLKCWADKPDERIMFTALLAFFKDYSEETTAFPSDGVETEFSIPHAETTVAY